MEYLIGQRVLIKGECIGTVVKPESKDGKTHFGIWVFSPARGYACDFSLTSVESLPNGQV